MSGKRNKERRKFKKMYSENYIVCPECGAIIEVCEDNEEEILKIMKKGVLEWHNELLQN